MNNLWQRFCKWLFKDIIPELTPWARLYIAATKMKQQMGLTLVESLDMLIEAFIKYADVIDSLTEIEDE